MPSAGIASRTCLTRQAGKIGKRMSSHMRWRCARPRPRARCSIRSKSQVAWRDDVFLDLPDRVGDVADHLDLREIDRVDLGRLGS